MEFKFQLFNLIILIIIVLQIPIIAILISYSNIARKYFNDYAFEFKWFSFFWIFNLLYFILLLICKLNGIDSSISQNIHIKTIINLLNVFCGLIAFYASSRQVIINTKKWIKIVAYIVIGMFFATYVFRHYLALFLKDYFVNHNSQQVFANSALIILSAIFFIFSYGRLSFFLRKIDRFYHAEHLRYSVSSLFVFYKKNYYFLSTGFFLYVLIQILIIINILKYDNIYELGFIISLMAKFIVLIGLHRLIILYAADKSYSYELTKQKMQNLDSLKETLGQTYHDMFRPLRNLYNALEVILFKQEEEISYSFKTKQMLKEIENALENVMATYSAQRVDYQYIIDDKKGKVDENSILADENIVNVNINKLVQIVILLFKREFKEKKIKITTDLAGKCNLVCNQNQVIRIISNLVKNSIDAINYPGGHISIKSRNYKDEGYVTIDIIDSGIGINVEDIDKIFEKGYTTKTGILHGYGLSIVRDLLKFYNGDITVISPYDNTKINENKGGCHFCLKLHKYTNTNLHE